MTSVLTVEWHAPGGQVWDLTGDTLRAQVETSGYGAPPGEVIRDGLYSGGSRVDHQRVGERIVTLPVMVQTTPDGFLGLWRNFTAAFTATRRGSPGKLRFTRPDGTWREASLYYLSGLEDGHGDGPALGHNLAALQLLAPDPFWYGPTTRALGFEPTTSRSWYKPFFTVSPGGGLGEVTLDVEGGVDTWPTWMFYGPFTTAEVRNSDGRGFVVDRGTATGERVTVVTDPRSFAVTVAQATSEQGELKARNEVINPSFEEDAQDWFAAKGTGTRDTTTAKVGAACLRYDSDTSVTGFRFVLSQFYPDVTPGATYTLAAHVLAGATFQEAYVRIQWYNAAGDSLLVSSGDPVALTSTWQRPYLTATAPDDADYVQLQIAATPDPGSTAAHFFTDAAMFNSGALLDYFDGDTAGTYSWSYQWDGDPHDSSSSYYGTKTTWGEETPATDALAWPGADPFALEPGEQQVELTLTDSTSSSGVELLYRPRHELP